MRRFVIALAFLPVFATAWLVGSALPAGAAMHPVTGTYQWFVQGSPAQTLTLLRHHVVGAPDSGTWSVSKHVVTVQLQGAPAGASKCQEADQPSNCTYSSVATGPKTATGIASASSPGTWTGYIGSLALVTEPFYAVRTGP